MLDVHTHFVPRRLPPPDEQAVNQGWPVLLERDDHVEVHQRGRVVRRITANAWDGGVRTDEMDRLGVARQVVMPAPFTFLYDADEEVAVRYARAQNDDLAELVGSAPERFYGLGSLPLQNPELAVEEAQRIGGLHGLYGVEIGTHAGDYQLHDDVLDPVFTELEELSLAVFVHPWQPVAPERTGHNGLAFGLGRPVETELAVGSLLFGGVLQRHPRLRVCLAHGGGGIPALRGRLSNGWSRQDPANRSPSTDPIQGLRDLWADGLTYDARALALAEGTFGTDRMVIGSDYPFAAQERSIGASFAEAADRSLLAAATDWPERTCANALEFLGVEPPTQRAPLASRMDHTLEVSP